MAVRKIIIHHGDRVTEHEVSDRPIVIGRDPQCDLFFADKKLSRRHARFEREGDNVRLVDLGSRNGSWVNEEQIEDRILEQEDSVRLGSLHITLEYGEAETGEDGESTLLLSTEASPDDSSTVILSSSALPDAASTPRETTEPSQTDAGTVMLPTGAPPPLPPDEDPTMETMERVPEGEREGVDQTVMLPSDRPAQDSDTGTVIYKGKVAPSLEAATRLAPAVDLDESGDLREPEESPGVVPFAADAAQGARASSGGTFRFIVLVVAVAALAVVVLALPLTRTLGSALAEESSLRGRALVDLLAAVNENALRESRPEALSLGRITGETGVVGASILDPAGRVVAPRDSSHVDSMLEELGIDVADIRTFRRIEAPNGDIVMIKPILGEGRRLGLAILQYRVAQASGRTMMALLLGSILLLMGVGFAVLLARRWTLLPIVELRDDVEALREGFVETLHEERPYSELSQIVGSFNELLQRHDPVQTVSDPSSDPTLIPGESDPT